MPDTSTEPNTPNIPNTPPVTPHTPEIADAPSVAVRVSEMKETLHDEFADLKTSFDQEIQSLGQVKTRRALTIEEEQLLSMEEREFAKRYIHLLDKSEENLSKMADRVTKEL